MGRYELYFFHNTDGIDISGKNVHIHDINISNYDDSICIKPLRNNSSVLDNTIMNCSENIIIENVNVYAGVGLSIGSVSSTKHNCIRNVTFQNIIANYPKNLFILKQEV